MREAMRQRGMPLVSVVLCTYNRHALMAKALQSLCEQTIEPMEYEIIAVDNNSNDTTKVTIGEFCRRHAQVRYCLEVKQGLSHARNAGMRVAQGEYVAYVDDDCTVPREWLAVAKEIILTSAPALFGGPYRACYDSQKPQWYRDSYGSHDCGSVARTLSDDEYLTGTNLFIRRTLLDAYGGFRPDLGMIGGRLGYGEETAFQRLIRQERPQDVIYYDPQLWVAHLVRPEKMSLWWTLRQRFSSGRSWQRVLYGTSAVRVDKRDSFQQAYDAFRSLCDGLVRGVALRDRARYPFVENYLYEVVFGQVQRMGAIYEQLTNRSQSFQVVPSDESTPSQCVDHRLSR